MPRSLPVVILVLAGGLTWVAAQEPPREGRKVALLVAVQDYADSG